MGRTAQVPLIAICLLALGWPARAQDLIVDRPVGPYVLDLRGSMIGVPGDPVFFPPVDETSPIPARAFGFELGGHVYPFSLGPARVGIGAGYIRGRGTVPAPGTTVANVSALVPQLSFNFGSRGGWSYLSAGYGNVRVRAAIDDEEADSTSLASINYGGGARWFLSDHLGVGFDVRFHRVSPKASAGTPGFTVLSVTGGISLR